jgi:hypothetical protein
MPQSASACHHPCPVVLEYRYWLIVAGLSPSQLMAAQEACGNVVAELRACGVHPRRVIFTPRVRGGVRRPPLIFPALPPSRRRLCMCASHPPPPIQGPASLTRRCPSPPAFPRWVCPQVAWLDHIRQKGTADLVLDTVSKNGHTSSCDALWAGEDGGGLWATGPGFRVVVRVAVRLPSLCFECV